MEKRHEVDTPFGLNPDFLICLFLGLFTLAVYFQVINHEFILFDDPAYVTENPHVRSGLSMKNILWAFSFVNKGDTYWHPLTWLSHMMDCQLYGLNPGMHHLTNLFLHMANSIFLFLVFRRMTGARWRSAFVAALFALHPINVDSVAWIAERKNLLSTSFWILTMLAYLHYSRRPGLCRYLMTLLIFTLGLLAKPMLVTVPFVLLLLDYWPLGRLRHPTSHRAFRLVLEKIPFLVLSGLAIYVTTSGLMGAGTVISTESIPMKLRIANALVTDTNYIGKMIWPVKLAFFYPYPEAVQIWKAACACLVLALISFWVLTAFITRPYLLVGWLWFLGTLVPVSGLMQVGQWPGMADRWAYVPLIGLFIVVSWGVPELVKKWRHKQIGLAIAASTALFLCAATTFVQIRYWANSTTLFEHALDVTKNNYVAHNNLGMALGSQGKRAESVAHFMKALQIDPRYVPALNNLGNSLMGMGMMDKAVNCFVKALRIDPSYALAHFNLGVALTDLGKSKEAIRQYKAAIRSDPDFLKAYNNLGVALVKQGKTTEAIRYYRRALQIDPSYTLARINLDEALRHQEQ